MFDVLASYILAKQSCTGELLTEWHIFLCCVHEDECSPIQRKHLQTKTWTHTHVHRRTGSRKAMCEHVSVSPFSISELQREREEKANTVAAASCATVFYSSLILSERPQTLAGRSWIMLSYNSKSNTVVLLTCDWKQWFLPLLYSVFWAIVLFGMCSVHGAICSIWTVWSLRYIIQNLMSEL